MDIIMATSQNLTNVKWLTIDQLDFSEGSDVREKTTGRQTYHRIGG